MRRVSDAVVSARRRVVDSLHEIRGYLRFPLRLRLDAEGHTRVVLYGLPYPGWNAVLADRQTWMIAKGVHDVVRIPACPALAQWFSRRQHDAVVIPIKDGHAARLPKGRRALAPRSDVISLLADKARFAAYMQQSGLSDLIPTTRINGHADVNFPAVLKPARHSSSFAVVVVDGDEQLERLLDSWAYRSTGYLVQELVPGTTEYASHCVCKSGRVLWTLTYRMEMDATVIRTSSNFRKRDRIETPPATVRQLERVLAPLDYSGICHVDYKVMPDGGLRIFEINPEIGAPLVSSECLEDLAEAFACVVANAQS